MTFHLQFETLSDFTYLPFLTRIFRGLKTPRSAALTQILVEAYNNAVIHGQRRDKKKWIGIAIDAGSKRTVIRVIDRGRGIQKKKRTQTPWGTHGRGLQIIRALAKHVTSRKKEGRHIFEATV